MLQCTLCFVCGWFFCWTDWQYIIPYSYIKSTALNPASAKSFLGCCCMESVFSVRDSSSLKRQQAGPDMTLNSITWT